MCRRSGPSLTTGKVVAALVAIFAGVLVAGGPAGADQQPSGCTQNRGFIDAGAAVGIVVNGDSVDFTVTVGNNPLAQADACDLADVQVIFRCPDATGNPAGPDIVLAASINLPADGSGDTVFPPVSCVINVTNPAGGAAGQAVMGDPDGAFPFDSQFGIVHFAVDSGFSLQKVVPLTVLECAVTVDKQVSCDGGATFVDQGLVTANEDGTFSCQGIVGETIVVRYVAHNAGTADVFSCTIEESNAGIGGTVNVGDLASGGADFTTDDNDQLCSSDLAAGEPNTATLSCFCTADLNPDLKAEASDTASFTCLAPELTIEKVCEPQEGGNNAVNITVHNPGAVDLIDCTVTDEVFPGSVECGDEGTGTAVTVTPDTFDLAAGNDQAATGTVSGLTANSCNRASVTCTIAGTTDTITATPAEDVCEVPQEAICRTPGFWGTHACGLDGLLVALAGSNNKPNPNGCEKSNSQNITQQVINAAGGTLGLICGVEITNTQVADSGDSCTELNATEHSAVEAICVSPTGNQRLQLARQLTAAALNCVISGFGADCSGGGTDLADLFSDCNTACTNNSGFGTCIGDLDAFNNGTSSVAPGCHDRELVNEGLGLDFEPPGPAGSSNACNTAIQNNVTIFTTTDFCAP